MTADAREPRRAGSGWRLLRWARSPQARATGRRIARALGVLAVVVAGAFIGTALAPSVAAQVGPLRVDVRVVPSLTPGVELRLPPAGQVSFDTHLAPVAIQAGISEVDLDRARAVIDSPAGLEALQASAPDALRTATFQASAQAAAFALGGAVTLGVLVYRTRWRRTRQVALATTVALGLTAGVAGATFDSDRFAQPRFEGLLSQAPYVASQTSGLVQRLESYRSGLADIVQSVTTLYGTGDSLPVIPGAGDEDVVTVLHVSDIHLNPLGFDLTERLAQQFAADVVVDTGDITTWGTEVESALVTRVRDVRVPYVFVRGNHDSARTQAAVAAAPNAVVLDGGTAQVAGLVFAGLGDPRFTPDGTVRLPSPAPPAPPVTSPPGSSPGGTAAGPPAVSASPAPSTAARAIVPGEDPEVVEGRRLAQIVRDWNAAHPDRPVAVAAFHEPVGTSPLDGLVPLVLSGHMHTRSVKTYPAGTRLMVQGSTGGAGLDSLTRDGDDPVPLTATVLYFARSGERAGQLLAYDDVTVGGFGLASAALERTVVRPEPGRELAPGEVRGTAACPPVSGSLGAPSGTALAGSPGEAAGDAPRDPKDCAGATSSPGSRSIRPGRSQLSGSP